MALGAAIRAAAVGGLAVYNPERRCGFPSEARGQQGFQETHIGGKVEALATGLDLVGGHLRLTLADLGYEDEQELTESGSFGFRRVPLQPSAENLLTFEVFDRDDALVATAGRPVIQNREVQRPTGGSTSTAVLSKAILMEVMREGKAFRRELIPALDTLPTNEDFTFSHPGDTELLRLPLYQHKRKIQEIKVPVASSLPKGTPIDLNINVDELSFYHREGKGWRYHV